MYIQRMLAVIDFLSFHLPNAFFLEERERKSFYNRYSFSLFYFWKTKINFFLRFLLSIYCFRIWGFFCNWNGQRCVQCVLHLIWDEIDWRSFNLTIFIFPIWLVNSFRLLPPFLPYLYIINRWFPRFIAVTCAVHT